MDVLDLKAKISLDKSEYDKGLDDASSKSSGFASKIAGGLGSAVSTVAKVGAAAVGVASTAVVAMTKQAVSSFADYEQLVGGVETLFGNAADSVVKKAEGAFETAGLSANEYMETVTSFSASLLQSVGGDTAKAAEYADKAITDMSDNANKMGSSMESIQNAYQGFAKQNYTMLDNLKLGYGGTKEEMARLLSDAEKLSGQKFDLSSYADIVEAIHVVQESMGIAGTTAKEASTTISGSLNMTKASWANLLTAIGQGDMGGISTAIDNLVSSAQTFASNVLPVVQRALTGIVQLIGALAPEIAAAIPTLVSDILPTIIDAGMQIISALGTALMDNIDTIVFAAYDIIEMLFDTMLKATSGEGGSTIAEIIEWILGAFQENYETLIDVGIQIITNIFNGITESFPTLLPLIIDIVMDIAQILVDNAPMLLDAGLQLILGLATGLADALPELIPTIVETVLTIVEYLIDNVDLLVDAALALIIGLAEGIINALPKLIEKAPEIVIKLAEAIIRNAPKILEAATKLIFMMIEGIVKMFGKIVEVGGQLVEKVKSGFSDKVKQAKEWGRNIIDNFINGIKEKWENLKQTVKDVAQTVKDFLGFSEPEEGPLSNFHTYAPDMMELFAKGIKDNTKMLENQIKKSFDFSDVITDQNYNITGTSKFGGMQAGNSVVINVYGAEGQDVNQLAEIINEKLSHMIGRQEAVYA